MCVKIMCINMYTSENRLENDALFISSARGDGPPDIRVGIVSPFFCLPLRNTPFR